MQTTKSTLFMILCLFATGAHANEGIANKAHKKGDRYIDFTLPNAKEKPFRLSEPFRLSDALKKGPVILTFYRGGWCPYCNTQLQGFQKRIAEIKAAGAQLVAVSPDKPKSTQDTVSANEIEFEVLSDKENQVARKYGLVFKLSKDLVRKYKGYGIDLVKSQGNSRYELPVPATYVINREGRIVYSFIDENYKKRAEIDAVIKALKN